MAKVVLKLKSQIKESRVHFDYGFELFVLNTFCLLRDSCRYLCCQNCTRTLQFIIISPGWKMIITTARIRKKHSTQQ